MNEMRRKPKQERSQQRVAHLLDTAAQLFDEQGVEATTTNMIAARSGVAIGSLYQFFPNKAAVIDALVERYIDALDAEVFQIDPAQTISQVMDRLVDNLAAFTQANPGFKAVFIDADVAQRIHDQILAATEAILGLHYPSLSAEVRRQTAVAGVAIVKGMMKLSDQTTDFVEKVELRDVKLALLAYLRAVLNREQIALPSDLAAL